MSGTPSDMIISPPVTRYSGLIYNYQRIYTEISLTEMHNTTQNTTQKISQ